MFDDDRIPVDKTVVRPMPEIPYEPHDRGRPSDGIPASAAKF